MLYSEQQIGHVKNIDIQKWRGKTAFTPLQQMATVVFVKLQLI